MRGEVMDKITAVGLDLAKQIIQVHGIDAAGRVVLRKAVRRERLLALLAQLPRCVVGMEACSGTHHWARQLTQLGHEPRIMAAEFVRPFRKSLAAKNDANDAEAICTGVVLPQSAAVLQRALPAVLADEERLPALVQRSVQMLREHLHELDARVAEFDRDIAQHAKSSAPAQRLVALSGVGPLTASAVVATVGNARDYRNGRQFAAWLGLVPRQYSSGGKRKLGRITRRGDAYLRALLIQGARSTLQAALRRAPARHDRLSAWIVQLAQRVGYHKTLVAIANKHARIIWALLARDQSLDLARASTH